MALGVTETVSYGILQYAFPVFIAPMGAELGWSTAAVTGAFSLATLVSAAAAVPARAALVAEVYGRASFGAVNGTLALLLALARAAAPIGASLLYLAGGGYPPVLAVLAALSLASAAALLGTGRPSPPPIPSAT
ncbi:MAG TPA: hypothetical protein VK358_00030 [Longimicrobium sp.]|nr:hypothetical protein [Longimicrobium sp.]